MLDKWTYNSHLLFTTLPHAGLTWLDINYEGSRMFELGVNWWELPVRATLIYLALLAMVRVSGRRTVGQFTPFDLLVVMLLSESVSSALNGGEESITGGLLAALTLVTLNMAVALVTSRIHQVQHLLEGRPILVGRDGQVYRDVLNRQRVPLADMEQALREADCDSKEMRFAFLEADGKISILKNSGNDVHAGSQ
jgi:uncharacterized membrane protein YcaP (DUF421 family)